MEIDPSLNTKRKSKYALAILALLAVMPPLFFWLTVHLKFDGGISVLFHIWNYLPDYLLKIIILLLPIPPLVLGTISLWRIWKHKERGVILGVLAILFSLIFIIFCTMSAIRPD